ncbi:MAG: sensor histidine kinase [Longimicrobiales bacterium]
MTLTAVRGPAAVIDADARTRRGTLRPPRSGSFRPWWAWWGVVTLWWTVEGLVSAAQVHSMQWAAGDAVSWGRALIPAMASAYLWVPLTMFALWSAARVPIERRSVVAPAMAHVAAAVMISVARAAAVLLLNSWVGWYADPPTLGETVLVSLGNNVFIYWLLVGVGHAVHYARTARLQQEQLAEARLRVLKSQLQPHFLFNALNTISAYVRTDAETAERIVDRLARLLRETLASGATHEVTLREELAALEPYLEIEQTRFEDRLNVRRSIDPTTLGAAVPHFLLQPLVENAIRHGLAPRTAPGTVEVAAWRDRETLCVRVLDDGVGLRPDFRGPHDWGVGLRNSHDRLRQLYGSGASLELSRAAGGGTAVMLRIPYRTLEASGA